MSADQASKGLSDNLRSALPPYVKHSSAILLFLQNTVDGNRILDSLRKSKLIPDSTIEIIDNYSKRLVAIPHKGKSYSRAEVLEKLSWVPFNEEKKFYGVSGDSLLLTSAYQMLNKDDIPAICEARRKTIYSASDEALDEYFELTRILFAVKNKGD
jgi:hypothetical protein